MYYKFCNRSQIKGLPGRKTSPATRALTDLDRYVTKETAAIIHGGNIKRIGKKKLKHETYE